MNDKTTHNYRLEQQVGFLLRQVNQRHTNLFVEMINDFLTPTQFSALVKLFELKACSQNMLGRHTAMDAATIKGVIDRLRIKGLIHSIADPSDKRRVLIELSEKGQKVAEEAIEHGLNISKKTLQPLSKVEQKTFIELLSRLR